MPEFKNSKDVDIKTSNFKCHVTGDYGSGKSTFASTCPQPGFVFDFDGGIETYRYGDWLYESFPLAAPSWIKFEKTMMAVEKMVNEGKIKTVIFDATTTMMDVAMERAMQIDPRRDPNTQGSLWNVHYQIVKNLLGGKLRKATSFNCNLVVLSHLEIKLNQNDGAIIGIEPLLTGRLSKEVPGYFGEVYNCTTRREGKKTNYYIQTKTVGFYKARSRISGTKGLLPDYVPNNYQAVMEEIEKNRKRLGQK